MTPEGTDERKGAMNLIIVAGMPATGKSTLAKALQKEFGYPILEKDGIKEELFDTIGFESYAEKRRLDIAANAVLLKVMEEMMKADASVIIDNNFDPASAGRLAGCIERYHPACVTVFMNGDTQVLYERYAARDSAHARHLGHAMQTHYPPHAGESTEFRMTREGFDQRFLHLKMDRISWGGKRIPADATRLDQMDVPGLVRQVREALGMEKTGE